MYVCMHVLQTLFLFFCNMPLSDDHFSLQFLKNGRITQASYTQSGCAQCKQRSTRALQEKEEQNMIVKEEEKARKRIVKEQEEQKRVKTLYPVIGEDKGCVQAFQAPKEGVAAAAGIEFGQRQGKMLSEALDVLKSLQDTPSVGLVGKARELVELLFEALAVPGPELRPGVEWKGGKRLSVDLRCLAPNQRGSNMKASEAWKDVPLLALQALSQELLHRVPAAIGVLEAWVQLHAGERALRWHKKVLETALGAVKTFEAETLGVRSHLEGAELLTLSSASLHTCYTREQGGIAALLRSSEGAKSAHQEVARSLANARQRFGVAQQEGIACTKAEAKARENIRRVREDLLPKMEGNQTNEEREACKCISDGLSAAAASLLALQERERVLVAALEAAERTCAEVMRQADDALKSAQVAAGKAEATVRERSAVQKEANQKMEANRPEEKLRKDVLDKAKENVSEVQKMAELAESELSRAKEGWVGLQKVLLSGLQEREEGHKERLRGMDLGLLMQDDLKTLLAGQGLGACYDEIKAKVDGKSLADFSKRSSGGEAFAEKLEEHFETIVQAGGMCARKRTVHCIQLVLFGLGEQIGEHSQTCAGDGEVGDGLPCCKWTPQRVRSELARRGLELADCQMEGVNGEALLLLRERYKQLVTLGIADTDHLCGIIDTLCRADPVGRLRLGLEKPRVKAMVGSMDADSCYRALAAAMSDDGKPCVLPAELVAEWTQGFSEVRLVGEGAFGKVYEGIITAEVAGRRLCTVAVKRLSPDVLLEGGEKHLKREINTLRLLPLVCSCSMFLTSVLSV
jgi:hypothetical protein